jgi:adenine-specific DNA methylase
MPSKSLLEYWIPVGVLSRDSAIEMSFKPTPAYLARCRELGLTHVGRDFYDPKIRSLHPWLARRSRSVARALNLAALLPPNISAEEFLSFLGFSMENLVKETSKGYPPLISYLKPNIPSNFGLGGFVILDPMAGGGSIPLESALLGVNTVACDYNPVSYLLLRATVEFPAKYGLELWRRLVGEVKAFLDYAVRELSPYYDANVEGYIILRQVSLGGRVIPLQNVIPLSRDTSVRVCEGGSLTLSGRGGGVAVRRGLLRSWMEEHVKVMGGKSELYDVLHRCVAVQTGDGFRLAGDSDLKLLAKAYEAYLSKLGSLILPDVELPRDNDVFSDLQPLGRYRMLFSPRQALALDRLISYVRGRVGELVEVDGEFGAALGLYLALGVDRVADFNSIITTWNHNTLTVRDSVGSYYKFRKFRLEGVYAEAIVPYRTLNWVYEPDEGGRTGGGICPVVRDLAERLEGKNCNIDVFMCDAMQLSKYFMGLADVVNVDPPYYDQHIYSDFSEFFWPLLRVMLEPAFPHLFKKDRVLFDWSPSSWGVPKSNEIVARGRGGGRDFEAKLEKALREIRVALKDDGLLILWFSHRSMEAWEATVRALEKAQFAITAIIPLPSEHPTRSVTRGGRVGINRVLILVARKRESVGGRDKLEILKRFEEYLLDSKMYPDERIPEDEVRLLTRAAHYAISKC